MHPIRTVLLPLFCVLSFHFQAQNVGVGVDTPQTKLHVAGTLLTDSLRIPNGAKDGLIWTSDSLGNGSWKPPFELVPNLGTIGQAPAAHDPNELVVSGNYAFVGNHQIGDIRSFDISGANPVPLDTLELPGPFPTKLAIVNDILVLQLNSFSTDTLYTVDISNPDSLYVRDALAVVDGFLAGHSAGNVAGFVTFSSGEFLTYDISNPDSIFRAGTLLLDNPVDIKIADTLAYVLESSLGQLLVISVADPAMPYVVSSTSLIADFPSQIVIDGSFAYIDIAVNLAPDKLQIVDVSDPLAPVPMGDVVFGNSTNDFDVEEPYAYVYDFSPDSLVVIDVSDKSNPAIIGHEYIGGALRAMVAIDKQVLYTEANDRVLRILGVGPTIPMLNTDGTFSSFDGSFAGLLEVRSPRHLDHLRLHRPGLGQVDFTVGRGFSNDVSGLLIRADEQNLLFARAIDGFMGLGVTNPTEKLHVNNGSVFIANLEDNEDTNEGFLIGNSSFQPDFGIVFDESFGDEKLQVKHMTFTDTTSLMTFHENGNVGVGIPTSFIDPEVKLDAYGSIRSVGGNVSIKDGLQSVSLNASASGHYLHLDVGGSTHSGDDIILGDLSGPSNKVGIGTSSPGSLFSNTLLDVRGGHIALANNFGVLAGHSSGTGIGAGFDSGTGDELDLWAGGAARVRIQADGNTGIGTTTPDRELTVQGGSSAFMNVKDGSRELLAGTNSDGGSLRTMTNHDLSFWTNNTRRMTIDAGGKLSLNTTSVRTMLTMRGPDHVDDGPILYMLGNNSDQVESGRIRFVESTSSTSWRGGYIHYDGSNNEMHIGVHNTSDKIIGNDNNVITIERSSGEVGIGTTNPSALLEVLSSTVKKVGGGSWTASSDIRLKQDIHDYRHGLEEILRIRPVNFRYNDKSGYDTSEQHVGVIAQELQEVTPYMISTFEKDGAEFLEVDNSAMTYMLINAVQELNAKVEALMTENAQLKTMLSNDDE